MQEFAYATAVVHSGCVGWERDAMIRYWLHISRLTSLGGIPDKDDRKYILFDQGLSVFEVVNVNFGGVDTRSYARAVLCRFLNATDELHAVAIDLVGHDWPPLGALCVSSRTCSSAGTIETLTSPIFYALIYSFSMGEIMPTIREVA